jgi:hypothetical protein
MISFFYVMSFVTIIAIVLIVAWIKEAIQHFKK